MAYGDKSRSVGALFAGSAAVFRRQAVVLLAMGLVSVGLTIGQRLVARKYLTLLLLDGQTNLHAYAFGALGIVTVIAHAFVEGMFIRHAMAREAQVFGHAPARFGTFIAVSLAASFAFLIGLCLLIVPGLMALSRWLLAPNFVLARGMDFREAFAASATASKGHRGVILGTYVLALVCVYMPMIVVWGFAGGLFAYNALPLTSPINLVGRAISMFAAAFVGAVSIALFAAFADRSEQVEDVFA